TAGAANRAARARPAARVVCRKSGLMVEVLVRRTAPRSLCCILSRRRWLEAKNVPAVPPRTRETPGGKELAHRLRRRRGPAVTGRSHRPPRGCPVPGAAARRG